MPELTTRRKLLTTTVVAGTAAVAGCGGDGGGGGGSSAAFESVEIDGDQLVMQLASDSVASVNVIGSNGEPSLGSANVATGATQVSFNLMQDYQPGEHTVVAVGSEGNEIGSTTQRLEPNVELDDFFTADMVSREEFRFFDSETPLVKLTNTGNVPAKLSYIELDNVPSPTIGVDYKKRTPEEAGILNEDEEGITAINPGQTVTGQIQGSPLSFGYDSPFECGTTEEATLTVGYQGVADQFTIPLEYVVAEQDSNPNLPDDQTSCTITVADQS